MVRHDPVPTGDIDPERTALLVIDMTNEFVADGALFDTPNAREMVPRLAEVIDRSREAGVQVIYTRSVNRPGGADAGQMRTMTPEILDGEAHAPGEQSQIYPPLEPADEDVVISKHRYDAFFETELDSVLRTLDVETLIVTGTATHICCDTTIRAAFVRGYEVVALEDLNATADIPDQGWGDVSAETLNQVFFTTVATNFGSVIDSEAFLERIED